MSSEMPAKEEQSCLACKRKIYSVSSQPHHGNVEALCSAEGHSEISVDSSGKQDTHGQTLSTFIKSFFGLSLSCRKVTLCCSCCCNLITLHNSFFTMRNSIIQHSETDVSIVTTLETVSGHIPNADIITAKEASVREPVSDGEKPSSNDLCHLLSSENNYTRNAVPSASIVLNPFCSEEPVARRVSSRIRAKQNEEPVKVAVSSNASGVLRKRAPRTKSSSKKQRNDAKIGKSSGKKKLKSEPDTSSAKDDGLPIVISSAHINVHRTGLSQNERQLKLRYFRRKLKYNYPCWHCDLHFEDLESCANHTEETHVPSVGPKMMCPTCCKVSKNKGHHEFHVQTCGEFSKDSVLARALSCSVCPRKFLRKADFERHLETHAEKTISCNLCSYKGPTEANVEAHKSRQHANSSSDNSKYMYNCDQCKKLFSCYQSLRTHVKYIHTEGGKEKLREISRQARIKAKLRGKKRKGRHTRTNFICSVCGVDCMSNMRFLSHMKMFHPEECKEGEYVCETCGKTFSYRAALYSHTKKVHVEERPFICDQCGKAYKTNQNLKDHLNHTHTEEGRLAYNAKMRLHQQRRKMLAAEIEKRKNQNLTAGVTESFTFQSLTHAADAPTASYNENADILQYRELS